MSSSAMCAWRNCCVSRSSGVASIRMPSPSPNYGLLSLAARPSRKECMMRKTVVIDCFPESVQSYQKGYAIVAVDVIRATTTAVTAVALGRRCFPTPSLDAAVPLAARLTNPLLVGELGGSMPYGFDLNNSPADLEGRTDIHRPMILLSTSGTRVICGAAEGQAMYVACLRNYSTLIAYLGVHHPMVAVIGAGSRGEFREE